MFLFILLILLSSKDNRHYALTVESNTTSLPFQAVNGGTEAAYRKLQPNGNGGESLFWLATV